ncbi:MAG TPA: hypothetical protein VHE34_25680 [Puia sp.]|uniref:hypothetical protein n=1 Tax=Puia sp. TaxID=2045100 RepID=UPI002CB775FB|nr:hypothetical protein [Puia sp.]HVU98649.1 hypothetical protein [Puia sp.]
MLKNYLLTAWRNLTRSKLFPGINLFGLAIGLGCFLLIALYVLDELSYDRWNTNANRIYNNASSSSSPSSCSRVCPHMLSRW